MYIDLVTGYCKRYTIEPHGIRMYNVSSKTIEHKRFSHPSHLITGKLVKAKQAPHYSNDTTISSNLIKSIKEYRSLYKINDVTDSYCVQNLSR